MSSDQATAIPTCLRYGIFSSKNDKPEVACRTGRLYGVRHTGAPPCICVHKHGGGVRPGCVQPHAWPAAGFVNRSARVALGSIWHCNMQAELPVIPPTPDQVEKWQA